MSHWDEFERVFIKNNKKVIEYNVLKTKVFEKDKVILTRHFSNGMPDKTVEFIANQLLKWQVSVK
jgi:hypothetical protein